MARYCDGIERRDFLKVGMLGTTGLTLGNYLRLAEAGEANGKAKAAIFINLAGGPSHMDTFDLKPNAPKEYRGTFNPIPTKVPGVEISEHLPKLASHTDKFVILRGVSHNLAAHELGTRYMITGNRPLPSIDFPGYGSVVSKELPAQRDLPPYVAVPDTAEDSGYLGIEHAAFRTNASPRVGQPFTVRGISLGGGVTITQLNKRNSLLGDLDRTFQGVEKNDLVSGLDKFSQRAYDIISSPRTREAFDISRESPAIAKLFEEPAAAASNGRGRGDASFVASCLLATRLVEAGVRFVTLRTGGWDTHQDNFTALKDRLLPPLDAGLAGLLAALDAKGLLESTAIFVTGEFGRTPKINTRSAEGGRDHWARAMFCLLAGGAVRGGQVIGASDDKGEGPKEEAITPDDVAASFYLNLGIDPAKEYHTSIGRPVMIVRNGRKIDGLFG